MQTNSVQKQSSDLDNESLEVSYKVEQVLKFNKASASFLLLAGLLLGLPFFFGGYYFVAKYIAYTLSFILAGYVLLARGSNAIDIQSSSTASWFLKFAGIISLYFCFQYLVLGLGQNSIDAALGWFFVFAIFIVTYGVLKQGGEKSLKSLIIGSCVLVAMVGLSHWFYDNGKLFWSFEPENIYTSERARWPFVNPNHLGNFLLLGIFFILARLIASINKFKELWSALQSRRHGPFKALLEHPRGQTKIFRIGFYALLFMTALICLTATLSRGSWTGFMVGAVLFIGFSLYINNTKVPKAPIALVVTKSNKKSKGQSFEFWAARFAKPVMILVGLGVFLFFLNEQGQELVQGRIEYGLLYSLDDIRWTMYFDTLLMLKDNLFFGVGIGEWANRYPAYMDESLSGLVVAYLHNELLQTLVELGLVGSLLILAVFSLILSASIKAYKASGNIFHLAALCGFAGFWVATFVEFPLRMPAIQALLAICIAFLIWRVDCKAEK